MYRIQAHRYKFDQIEANCYHWRSDENFLFFSRTIAKWSILWKKGKYLWVDRVLLYLLSYNKKDFHTSE